MSAVARPPLALTLALLAAPFACTEPPPEHTPTAARAALKQQARAPAAVRLAGKPGRAGEVMLQAGWGAAPGQLGRRTEASHPGPMSLAADAEGRLYLLDQVNRRVCVYSPAGRLARLIALESETVEDLALGGGSLWTLAYVPGTQPRYRVDGRDRESGAHRLRVELAPSIQLVTGLFVTGEAGREEVWVEVRHEAQVQVVRAGRGLPPGEQVTWRQGRPSRRDRATLLTAAKAGPAAAQIQRITAAGPTTILRVATPAPLHGLTALASDLRGRIYLGLALQTRQQERTRRVVLVHDPAGRGGELLELGDERVTDSFRPIAVGPRGAVYQLQSSEAGVTVLRWRTRGGAP